jgi:hypothetical protein
LATAGGAELRLLKRFRQLNRRLAPFIQQSRRQRQGEKKATR